MQKAIKFNNTAIKAKDYLIYFWYMSKDLAINRMNNAVFRNKITFLE